jgi:hypothetical protein
VNRRERRSAQKVGPETKVLGSAPARAPVLADAGKPNFLLRATAKILLSDIVLNRIRHPQVLQMLMEVARQAGRLDAAQKLQALMRAGQ